ncbi:MAG TPA: hypothetical protein PLI07_03270, partial [Candidatus Hydrogenedentes bacterium]|nr:hypothetical protein [Candidatus Hydrogenedentota bacterium]
MGKGVVAAIAVMLIAGGSFGERFEADCASGTGWDVLDFVGDGTFRPVEGVNCPPGYGPKVLRMEGSELLVLPKGGAFLGGTVVVLYRENVLGVLGSTAKGLAQNVRYLGYNVLPMLVMIVFAREPDDLDAHATFREHIACLFEKDGWAFSLIYAVTFGGFIGLTTFLPSYLY